MSELKPHGKRTNHHKGIAKGYLAQKRKEALERQTVYNKLSVQEILDGMNRENYVATRQRQKLAARLAKEQNTAKPQAKTAQGPKKAVRRDK